MDTINTSESLQKRGERLASHGIFPGCGVYRFEKTGRAQLEVLIRHGLNPWSKLLDIGCGALCGGYWMMNFLDPGGYHGIEPNREMFNAGVEYITGPELIEQRQARFDHNDRYDFSVFDETFDFFHAHSIWTHAPKKDIEKMLDGVAASGAPGARFITSYKAPTLFRPDYQGDDWVGISHESDQAGIVRHRLSWIEQACQARGLSVTELKGEKIHKQQWLQIEKS